MKQSLQVVRNENEILNSSFINVITNRADKTKTKETLRSNKRGTVNRTTSEIKTKANTDTG